MYTLNTRCGPGHFDYHADHLPICNLFYARLQFNVYVSLAFPLCACAWVCVNVRMLYINSNEFRICTIIQSRPTNTPTSMNFGYLFAYLFLGWFGLLRACVRACMLEYLLAPIRHVCQARPCSFIIASYISNNALALADATHTHSIVCKIFAILLIPLIHGNVCFG